MGVPNPAGEGNPQPKHAIAYCCCHLASMNEEFDGLVAAIPPFTELSWCLLVHVVYGVIGV